MLKRAILLIVAGLAGPALGQSSYGGRDALHSRKSSRQ
jgi:hypothetical protein